MHPPLRLSIKSRGGRGCWNRRGPPRASLPRLQATTAHHSGERQGGTGLFQSISAGKAGGFAKDAGKALVPSTPESA